MSSSSPTAASRRRPAQSAILAHCLAFRQARRVKPNAILCLRSKAWSVVLTSTMASCGRCPGTLSSTRWLAGAGCGAALELGTGKPVPRAGVPSALGRERPSLPSGNGGRRTSVRLRRAAVKIIVYHACLYFAFPFVFIAFYTHGAGASPSSACGSPRAPGSLAELGAGLGDDRALVACFVRLDREPGVRADDRELVVCLFVSIVNLSVGLGLCGRSAARGGFRPRCACCSSAS